MSSKNTTVSPLLVFGLLLVAGLIHLLAYIFLKDTAGTVRIPLFISGSAFLAAVLGTVDYIARTVASNDPNSLDSRQEVEDETPT